MIKMLSTLFLTALLSINAYGFGLARGIPKDTIPRMCQPSPRGELLKSFETTVTWAVEEKREDYLEPRGYSNHCNLVGSKHVDGPDVDAECQNKFCVKAETVISPSRAGQAHTDHCNRQNIVRTAVKVYERKTEFNKNEKCSAIVSCLENDVEDKGTRRLVGRWYAYVGCEE